MILIIYITYIHTLEEHLHEHASCITITKKFPIHILQEKCVLFFLS